MKAAYTVKENGSLDHEWGKGYKGWVIVDPFYSDAIDFFYSTDNCQFIVYL